MKNPKVLLVYPPNQLMDIETPRPDGSLGPLYLAGALEDAGIEVDILDASVGTAEDRLEETFYNPVMQENNLIRIGMTEARMSEVIAKGDYTVIGINSNFTPQTKMAFEVARAAKAVSKDILVVAGGVNARALAERFLASGVIDAVCLTEGERIFLALLRAWEKSRSLAEVSGIARLQNGQVVRQKVKPGDTCQNLDELPLPRWNKLPYGHYDLLGPRGVLAKKDKRSGSTQTSRGCWASCEYCHISEEKAHAAETGNIGNLRFKSVERVIEEARQMYEFGIRQVYFEDDTLLARKARIYDIFTRIRSMGFEISDVNGVNLIHLFKNAGGGHLVVDREFLEMLKDAGFDRIVFPVESASQRIVDKYATGKLNHQKIDVVELVRVATEVGVTCPINMMIGFPDETEAEIRESIEMGRRLVEAGSAFCVFFIPIPFPGSGLYRYAIEHGHLDSNFDTDVLNWKNCVMKNTEVPPERIVELRNEASSYANRTEYIKARIETSAGVSWRKREAEIKAQMGPRWESGAPAVAVS